jgi:adenylate kinase
LRLVLLGPPGSGKGTQAAKLCGKLSIPQISTGDILRQAAAGRTDLGNRARSYMDEGRLVPDEMMLSLVDNRITESDCLRGFVLDGFPRTLPQAMGLEEILRKCERSIDLALFIHVPDRVILERLSRRRVCPDCGALYNLDADPPEGEGVCDECGTGLSKRADDEERTVLTRLQVYKEDTLPVIEFYDSRGILRKIDGTGTIEEVFSVIETVLDEAGKDRA